MSKLTIEEVTRLSRNLPPTRKVPAGGIRHATPGQLGLFADPFRTGNPGGYDRGTTGFPDDRGGRDPPTPDFIGHAQDPVLHGDVGCGKTRLAIAIGRRACGSNIPTMFSTAAAPIMTPRKAKQDNRLDREPDRIGRNRLPIIDEPDHPPIDIDGARPLFQVVANSHEKRSIIFTGNLESGRWGDVSARRRHGRRVSIDRIIHHGRITRLHGESHRGTHALMNNQQQQGRRQPPNPRKTSDATAQIQ